jgi:hypothetical protein
MSPIVSRHEGIDEGIPRCRFNALGVSLVPVPIDSASISRSESAVVAGFLGSADGRHRRGGLARTLPGPRLGQWLPQSSS